MSEEELDLIPTPRDIDRLIAGNNRITTLEAELAKEKSRREELEKWLPTDMEFGVVVLVYEHGKAACSFKHKSLPTAPTEEEPS